MDDFDEGGSVGGSLYYMVEERLVRVGEAIPFGEIRPIEVGDDVPMVDFREFRMTMHLKLPWWQRRAYTVRGLRSGGKSHRGKETRWSEG